MPTPRQILRRCVGLLRGIDMVQSLRRYTTCILLMDLLRHGSQYLALCFLAGELLLSSERQALRAETLASGGLLGGGLALVCGLAFLALSQLLLWWLLGFSRLSVGNLLRRGRVREAAVPVFLCASLVLADFATISVHPCVTELKAALGRNSGGDVEGGDHFVAVLAQAQQRCGGAAAVRTGVAVAVQALLRLGLVVELWWAQRRASATFLP